jgi:thymidylate synthase
LVIKIITEGTLSSQPRKKYADGTPANYKQIIGHQMVFDNSQDDAIICTSRKAAWKSSIRELFWIWKLRSNDVNELKKLKCNFWDEWQLDDGTIGKAYGYQLQKKTYKHASQVDYIIDEIKNNKDSRRIITELWNAEELEEMSLAPCVHLTQWSVIDDKLYLEVRQRSCDVALGLVANVFQYSILHKLIAKECGLEPANMIWSIHNAHIYDRHFEQIAKQIYENETFSKDYNLNVKLNCDGFNSWDNPDCIELINYCYGKGEYNYERAI